MSRSGPQCRIICVLCFYRPNRKAGVSREYMMKRAINLYIAAVLLSCCFSITSLYADESSRPDVLSDNVRKVMVSLENALGVHDEIPTLKDSKWLGRDQKSARHDLDNLIEKAIALLESDNINTLRRQYRQLENKIKEEQSKLSQYRAERILAVSDERSLRTRLVPGETLKGYVAVSKADYDMLIEATSINITAYQAEIKATLSNMSAELLSVGVKLKEDDLDILMSSVTGEDIISMSVVFNAIKEMTIQLAELTQQTGEDLVHAKKYYGMVVILHNLIVKMQKDFIAEVDEKYLPKLNELRKSADDNIKEAQNLAKSGVNAQTLQNNIRANELTLKAINVYDLVLKEQKAKVLKAYTVSQQEMRIANNTYKTVSLSSAVVGLINAGVRTFEHLIALQMPEVYTFQNSQMRDEFKKLTVRMNSTD